MDCHCAGGTSVIQWLKSLFRRRKPALLGDRGPELYPTGWQPRPPASAKPDAPPMPPPPMPPLQVPRHRPAKPPPSSSSSSLLGRGISDPYLDDSRVQPITVITPDYRPFLDSGNPCSGGYDSGSSSSDCSSSSSSSDCSASSSSCCD